MLVAEVQVHPYFLKGKYFKNYRYLRRIAQV